MDTSNTHIIYLLLLSGAPFEPRRNDDKMDTSNTHNILFIYLSCLVPPLSLVETKAKQIHLAQIHDVLIIYST